MMKHAHSGIRWIVLILVVFAVVNALMKWKGNKSYTEKDRKLGFFSMLSMHIQFLIGLVLYFISPKIMMSGAAMKDPIARFFTVEHVLMMLIAIALITIGNSKAKKAVEDSIKFKKTFWFYLIGLLLMLVSIPWPFMKYGGAWF